jgi:hypothetical protein
MSTADEAASAAILLRQQLANRPSVRLIDIGMDHDSSHFVRVWVKEKPAELVAALPQDVGGVAVRVATM